VTALTEQRPSTRTSARPVVPGHRRWLVAVRTALSLLVFTACDRVKGIVSKSDSSKSSSEALAATAKPTRQAAPYVARPLDAFGRATGVVQIEGPPPLDSLIQPTIDQTPCGPIARRGIERFGFTAVGVVVWLEGLRSGKPLPVERRFEIANDQCMLVPEVQTAIAGGTLNIRNLDQTEHRTRITRRDGGELVATIRETDEGQVVPNEHVLSKPGILHLACEAHPWTEAWIAVFDHPYYATTGQNGSFSIDSIPPGRYAVRAWHPRLGAIADSITIEGGKTVSVTLRTTARTAQQK
jgi:polysaccharide lyase family 4-like protein